MAQNWYSIVCKDKNRADYEHEYEYRFSNLKQATKFIVNNTLMLNKKEGKIYKLGVVIRDRFQDLLTITSYPETIRDLPLKPEYFVTIAEFDIGDNFETRFITRKDACKDIVENIIEKDFYNIMYLGTADRILWKIENCSRH